MSVATQPPRWVSAPVALRLCFALLFLVFFPQGDQFLARTIGLPMPPTLLFFVIAAPMLAVVIGRELRLRRQGSPLLALLWRSLPAWVPFVVLALLSLAWALHPDAFWEGGPKRIFLLTYDCSIFFTVLAIATLPAIRDSWRSWLGLSYAALLVTTLWDVLQPGTFSQQMGRAAGLAQNANFSAALLVAACAGLIRPRHLRRRDWILLALTAVGVLATLSRGGAVLFGVLLVAYLASAVLALGPSMRRSAVRRLFPVVIAAGLILAAAIGAAREGIGMFERPTARARIGILTGDEDLVSGDEGRLRLLAQAWEQVVEAPLVGHGTGASYASGRGFHNMYMDVWVQFGIAGLLAYLALLAGGAFYFLRQGFLPGLLLIPVMFVWGFLQHGLLDERGLVMLYGLLVAAALPD
ncbi:MAG: O-antigen ligase family protein, partial [Acidobacteria bacterium]|nr:O-antigen ligase family protein [Acidobacteriota bacterium]